MHPGRLPDVTFHTRVRNDALGGPNPFEWKEITTADLFAGKNAVVFGLPGAFTPACSDGHLPGYERHYDHFRQLGIDQVVCVSVNDAFVMYQWAQGRDIRRVYMLPDGNGDFTRLMGMLVLRTAQGMGPRSWRYSMHVEDRAIRKVFAEPGLRDNPPGVPVEASGAEAMLEYLRSRG